MPIAMLEARETLQEHWDKLLAAIKSHPFERNVRDTGHVAAMYHSMGKVLGFAPLPITPLKMALFAVCYSPAARHIAVLETSSEGARLMRKHREFRRLTANEMLGPAMQGLERLRTWTMTSAELNRLDNVQWAIYKAGIVKDVAFAR